MQIIKAIKFRLNLVKQLLWLKFCTQLFFIQYSIPNFNSVTCGYNYYHLGGEGLGGERKSETNYIFCNGQDHDHSSSSSKSSSVSEENKAKPKLKTKSLEGSPTQPDEFKSCENLASPKKSGYADHSNKPADIVGELSTDQAALHNSDFPSPTSCIRKSNTISNGPTTRHRIMGRTAVSKSFPN